MSKRTPKGTDIGEKDCISSLEDFCNINLVGGKAFNISKMARNGFCIPHGVCITAKAYEYFMDFNEITPEGTKTAEKIQNGIMPPVVKDAIVNAYHKIGGPVAVRSSSPVEDLEKASFAGQYTSILHIQEDTIIEAVKKCWASLWSTRAVEYRKIHNMTEPVVMAVLIQEMVPVTASGVMFTGDATTIEAVWGLGDILVGGKVNPYRFIVKNSIVTEVNQQEIMHTMDDTGLHTVKVPDSLKDRPVLTEDQVNQLCALGKKVEALFGCPQDIEWGIHNNEFVVFQARPITVLDTEPVVWSRANAAETQPGYVMYLSRIPENKPDDIILGLTPLLQCFGIRKMPEGVAFRSYIHGYIYLNMTAVANLLGQIPGLSPEILFESLGHTTEDEQAPGPKLGLPEIVALLPGTLRVIKFFWKLPYKAEQVIPKSVALREDIKRKNLDALPLEELDRLVWDMYDKNSQVFQVHSVTALAVFALFGIIQKIVQYIKEEGAENALTIGLEGMSSSTLGIKMWKLAEYARKSPTTTDIILSCKNGDAVQELEKCAEAKEFLEKLHEFSAECGDRCSEEMELSVPRWEEDTSFVLFMVANYLESDVNPVKTMEKQKKIRQETTERILKKLSGHPLKLVFKIMLKKTQQYIVVRENLKTTWVRGISVLRELYVAIAKKLVENIILEDKNDIFYLKMTEVSQIIEGVLQRSDVRPLIEERKKEERVCKSLEVPEVITGEPPPVEELQYTAEFVEKLSGTGCSRGLVTGTARVVLDPRECSEFEKGNILVAPITDPGWSPFFVTAGGVVMELGGTLSHGVIIAREYGIPAVVGVKNATRLIKTGDTITVDGNTGRVYIRESAQ
jgi:phosphoenolpyruvate synthase/pyruvate phosphate dikinase